LVQRGHGPLVQPSPQGWLTYEDHRSGGTTIHVRVRDHPQVLELVGVEEVTFVDNQEHPPSPFALGASQGVSGLGDKRSTMEPRCAAQGGDDQAQDPPAADGRVGALCG